jgi:DHA2 family multidrug resistance protein
MNLKLFKHKNFAVCALLMIMVGGLINATTVLQPQFSQALLRYTATLPERRSPAEVSPSW